MTHRFWRLSLLVLLISGIFAFMTTAFAQTGDAELDAMVERLQTLPEGSTSATALREDIIAYVLGLSSPPEAGSDYRRLMVRGEMADEMGQVSSSADEYRAATLIAPWRADAYYQLGRAEEAAGNPAAAVEAYRMYLKAAPEAADYLEVEEKTFRLEFQAETQSRPEIPRQADTPPTQKPAFPTPSRRELLFYERPEGTPEPLNMEQIASDFPTMSSFSRSGKILVVFDIGANGRTSNFRVLAATRSDFSDEAEWVVKKMKFTKSQPYSDVVYDFTFCKRTDRIRKLICDIRFEDLTGDGQPVPDIDSFTVPNYNTTAVRKGYCGTVTIKFDVTSDGTVANSEIISSSGAGGQFGFNAKEAIDMFEFDKGRPVNDVTYKIGFGLPGTCKAS